MLMSLGQRLQRCIKALRISQSDLAALCSWEGQARINHYVKDRREPSLNDIRSLAKALKTTPEWLAFGIGRAPSYLRPIELDLGSFPLVTWSSLTNLLKTNKKLEFDNVTQIISLKEFSKETFIIPIINNSMTSFQDYKIVFTRNDLLFVDPTRKDPKNEEFVIAYAEDWQEPLFMQFNIVGSKKYLKLLADKQIFEFDEKIKIIGVVIARLNYLT